ncbi:hypothetical protein TNCV_1626181 [Trichonephila clavipes]|nr:hypothetical protein TNCV_1626181 [Trichonephila clavipes]
MLYDNATENDTVWEHGDAGTYFEISCDNENDESFSKRYTNGQRLSDLTLAGPDSSEREVPQFSGHPRHVTQIRNKEVHRQ